MESSSPTNKQPHRVVCRWRWAMHRRRHRPTPPPSVAKPMPPAPAPPRWAVWPKPPPATPSRSVSVPIANVANTVSFGNAATSTYRELVNIADPTSAHSAVDLEYLQSHYTAVALTGSLTMEIAQLQTAINALNAGLSSADTTCIHTRVRSCSQHTNRARRRQGWRQLWCGGASPQSRYYTFADFTQTTPLALPSTGCSGIAGGAGSGALACGYYAAADGTNSTAVGTRTKAFSDRAVAVGYAPMQTALPVSPSWGVPLQITV